MVFDTAAALQTRLRDGLNANKVHQGRESLLHYAVRRKAAACVKALLEAGAGADAPDLCGNTPLALCADSYYTEKGEECLRLLIAAGAGFNIADCGNYYFFCNPLLNSWRVHADFY